MTRGFQRRGAHPVPAEPPLDDPVCTGEVACHVPERERPLEDDVALQGLVEAGRVWLHRGERIVDRWELLVLDLDPLAGVLGGVARGRRDGCHGLADETDLLDRDGMLRDRLEAAKGELRRLYHKKTAS